MSKEGKKEPIDVGSTFEDFSTEDKLRLAKQLMNEVTIERRKERKSLIDNEVCRCGHKRKDHSDRYSVNYTGGFCNHKGCKCENFLSKTHD